MKAALKVASLVFVLMPAVVLSAKAHGWPVVRPFQERRTFVNPGQDNTDTPFVAFIDDSGGTPVYKLECHNGNYDDDQRLNFSGDFQCGLFAVKGETPASGNLLAANTRNERSTDWWNRGRMRSPQLRGECLEYPEYSTVRHFTLRGMVLTLSFTGVGWSSATDRQGNPLLGRFTFEASATPDPSARTSRAEEAAGPVPPRSCYP